MEPHVKLALLLFWLRNVKQVSQKTLYSSNVVIYQPNKIVTVKGDMVRFFEVKALHKPLLDNVMQR